MKNVFIFVAIFALSSTSLAKDELPFNVVVFQFNGLSPGPGKLIAEEITESDPRHEQALSKLRDGLSLVTNLDPAIKSVNISFENKPDSLKEDGNLSFHINDPMELVASLLALNPKTEPAIVKYRDEKIIPLIKKYVSPPLVDQMYQYCLVGTPTAIDKVYFSEFEGSLDFSFYLDSTDWSLSLRGDSCLLRSFAKTVKDAEQRILKTVSIFDDLADNPLENNPTPVIKVRRPLDGRTPIGVIDSGVDYNDQKVQEKLISPPDHQGPLPYLGLDLVENDGLPYDFYVEGGGLTFTSRGLDYRFNYQHGSDVALTATRDAEELALIPIRISEGANGEERTGFYKFGEALSYLKRHGVKCVNLSVGTENSEYSEALYKAIQDHHDLLIITSAGNDQADLLETPYFPSNINLPNIISVASTNADGDFSLYFSNYNKLVVDIAAVGEEVPTDLYGFTVNRTGTSFAAPKVTQVCGKLHRKYPDWSVQQIRDRIILSAKPRDSLKDYVKGGLWLDEEAALR